MIHENDQREIHGSLRVRRWPSLWWPLGSVLLLLISLHPSVALASEKASPAPRDTPAYALTTYGDAVVETLARLVAYPTVHDPAQPNKDNPHFKALTAYLREEAASLGLDFADYGAVVVVGLGTSEQRLGLVTHADVQPADATKWAKGPFTLDEVTRPGYLIGRGSEDDKGSIAAALFALKAVRDRGQPLARRVELIISYSEESNWDLFTQFLKDHPPPDLNVALDAQYPVVVAEKGWCSIELTVGSAPRAEAGPAVPELTSFSGGVFLGQVPEDATALIVNATAEVVAQLQAAATADTQVKYDFDLHGGALLIRAHGVSAHSGSPEKGVNAITHLAELLSSRPWPATTAAAAVHFVHDLVGTGYYAERFGSAAYGDPFMGPLTLSLGYVRVSGDRPRLGINLRRPVGKPGPQLEQEIRDALAGWQARSGFALSDIRISVNEPYDARNAPHVPKLMGIFKRYTGQTDAVPIGMGGGSHARLVPNGVNFGPVMPGETYTGHSERESIRRSDLMLSLQMYTALIEELAGGH